MPVKQAPRGSCCRDKFLDSPHLPYCLDLNVNMHHNNIIGELLHSATNCSPAPRRARRLSFCTGSDYYKFNYNWVCGNQSSRRRRRHRSHRIELQRRYRAQLDPLQPKPNPTIPANGGGMLVMGTPDIAPVCAYDRPGLPICPPVLPSDGKVPDWSSMPT